MIDEKTTKTTKGWNYKNLGNLLPTFANDYNQVDEKPELISPARKTINYKGEKRKRTEIVKNGVGKYFCQDCSYQTTKNWHFKEHVESIHEVVRYFLFLQ